MGSGRYLCSDLVTLKRASGPCVVNLEEISETLAVFEAEGPFDVREQLCIECEGALFHGFVSTVEKHEFGWRIEMELSPLTPWSPERFRPRHLLDLATLSKLE